MHSDDLWPPSSIFNSSNVELIRILEFQVIPISHIASCILCQRSPNTFDVHVWCMTSAPWNKSSYVQECIPSSLRPWSHGISGIEKDKMMKLQRSCPVVHVHPGKYLPMRSNEHVLFSNSLEIYARCKMTRSIKIGENPKSAQQENSASKTLEFDGIRVCVIVIPKFAQPFLQFSRSSI